MVAHRQPRLIALPEAARLCGRTPDELRRWCATGRLRCDRVADEWFLLEDDLPQATGLRAVDGRPSDRTVLSIAFEDPGTARRAHDQLRQRFGLGDDRLALAPLALDGSELVLVAGSFPAAAVDEVVDLARFLGGMIVDGIDESRISPSRLRRDQKEGRSSYG